MDDKNQKTGNPHYDNRRTHIFRHKVYADRRETSPDQYMYDPLQGMHFLAQFTEQLRDK